MRRLKIHYAVGGQKPICGTKGIIPVAAVFSDITCDKCIRKYRNTTKKINSIISELYKNHDLMEFKAMELKQEYQKESGKSPIVKTKKGEHIFSSNYVEWLEKKVLEKIFLVNAHKKDVDSRTVIATITPCRCENCRRNS